MIAHHREGKHRRRATAAMLLFGLLVLSSYATPLAAQSVDSAELIPESPASSAPAEPPARQRTLMDSLKAGGSIGAVIILLSVIATGFGIEHILSIRKSRIVPEASMQEIEQLIAAGRIQEAIDYCADPRNSSLASDIVLAGLERFQTSEFGFAEYKSAVEEAGEEATARLYRKIDVLNLIGVIAPMLGLLGTVQGMIESFNKIASRHGAARPDELADSISLALVTTFLGLIVAIPAMVAYSYFRNRIDSLVAETGKRLERVMMPLARRR